MRRIYFIYFPQNSPVFSYVPDDCIAEGFFADLQEAIGYFSGAGRKTEEMGDEAQGSPGGAGMQERSDLPESKPEKDIAVVNCHEFYRHVPFTQKEPDGVLLQCLTALRQESGDIGIRLLMPQDKSTDQNLLVDLMSRGFYDFWFLSSMEGRLFLDILDTRRDFRAMEAYLNTLPMPDVSRQEDVRENVITKFLKGQPVHEGIAGKWLGKGVSVLSEKVFGGSENPLSAGKAYAWMKGRGGGAGISLLHIDRAREEYEGETWETLSERMPEAPPGRGDSAFPDEETLLDMEQDSADRGKRFPIHIPKAVLRSFPGRKDSPDKASPVRMPSSAAILFYSEEDCLLPYALAFLSAVYLASSCGKTLLVELPGSGSRLAEALGIRHEERNLHSAIQSFASGDSGAFRRWCFNGPEIHGDAGALDKTAFSRRLPRELYFLPDNGTQEQLIPYWEGFQASLIHWAAMEERFSFILYVGFGGGADSRWISSIRCSKKVIAYPPWPAAFSRAQSNADVWQKSGIPVIDGSWGMKYIQREIKTSHWKEYVIVPGTVKEDFIQMTAFLREAADMSPESAQCLRSLYSLMMTGRGEAG